MITDQIVQNGDFEDVLPNGMPVTWVCDPTRQTTYTATVGPYSGTGGASFGNWNEAVTDYLYQTLTFPENCIATLSFYLSIVDIDAGTASPYNTFSVKIRSIDGQTDLATLASWTNQDVSVGKGYKLITFDVSNFSDQSVQLYFTSTQTDGTKNTIFYVDHVRIDTYLRLPVSTWAPLVSNLSRDFAGSIQQYGNRVYCSCLIRPESSDLFFYPLKGLTGYGADGTLYTKGVPQVLTKARWWEEATGGGDQTTRGALQPFPPTALVLATDESITILNPSDNLSMWMIFRKKANHAYSPDFGISGASFVPSGAFYDSGIITISFDPTVGSTVMERAYLNIDLTSDFVFLDLPT
jgi:hypothetical protein